MTITSTGRAIGHYARFIRRGAKRIDATSSDPLLLVSAFRDDAQGGRLVLVAINNAPDTRTLKVDMAGASISGMVAGEQSTAVAVWKATAALTPASATSFTVDVAGESVTTFAAQPGGAAGSGGTTGAAGAGGAGGGGGTGTTGAGGAAAAGSGGGGSAGGSGGAGGGATSSSGGSGGSGASGGGGAGNAGAMAGTSGGSGDAGSPGIGGSSDGGPGGGTKTGNAAASGCSCRVTNSDSSVSCVAPKPCQVWCTTLASTATFTVPAAWAGPSAVAHSSTGPASQGHFCSIPAQYHAGP